MSKTVQIKTPPLFYKLVYKTLFVYLGLIFLTSCTNNSIVKVEPAKKINDNEFEFSIEYYFGLENGVSEVKVVNNKLIVFSHNGYQDFSMYTIINLQTLEVILQVESPLKKYYLESFTYGDNTLYCHQITQDTLYYYNRDLEDWQNANVILLDNLFSSSIEINNGYIFYARSLFGIALQSLKTGETIWIEHYNPMHSELCVSSYPYGEFNAYSGSRIYGSSDQYIICVDSSFNLNWKSNIPYDGDLDSYELNLQEPMTIINYKGYFIIGNISNLILKDIRTGLDVIIKKTKDKISRVFLFKGEVYVFFKVKNGYKLRKIINLQSLEMEDVYKLKTDEQKAKIYAVDSTIYIWNGREEIKLNKKESNGFSIVKRNLENLDFYSHFFVTDKHLGRDFLIKFNE